MKKICLIITLIIVIYSCKKESIACTSPPSGISFVFSKFNKEINGRIVDSISICYFMNNVKKNISDKVWLKERNNVNIETYNILYSQEMGTLCGFQKINQFYFEFNNGNVDTLFIEMQEVNKDNCNSYEIIKASYNNLPLTQENSVQNMSVYKLPIE